MNRTNVTKREEVETGGVQEGEKEEVGGGERSK